MKRTPYSWYLPLVFAFFFWPEISAPTSHAVEDGDVLVEAGETVLTVGEFKGHLARVSAAGRAPVKDPEKRRQFLEFLIDSKLLALEARKEGLDKDPGVAAKIREATDRILADEVVVKRIPRDVEVSADEAKAYYEKNVDKFTRDTRVLVRQIVLKTREEAEAVLAGLKGGADFETLAREKSTDLTAKSGGLVGWLRKGRLPKEVEEAAYALKKGEVSPIISAQKGYYIVKVENRQDGEVIPLDQAKGMVESKAALDKRRRMLEELRTKLRATYKVEMNSEAVKEVIGK